MTLRRKNGGNRAQPKRGPRSKFQRRPQGAATRSRGDIVLAQGAMATTRSAFGGTRMQVPSLACWDAKLPQHIALPRSVGPYLVVRTTKRFNIDQNVTIFGTFKTPFAANTGVGAADGGKWSHVCAMSDVDSTAAIGGSTNALFHEFPMSGFGSAATVCPAGMTVQLVSPNAIGKAVGVAYCGVMTTQAALGGDTRTWIAYAEQFVEFMNPRVLMAGKMGLRGVQISSYPLNMSAVSEFTQLNTQTNLDQLNEDTAQPVGWAPIMLYMPTPTVSADETPLTIEALVTTEWRVRFDLTNPASAGHKHHSLSSDMTWEMLMRKAVSLGNGVMDISDVIANSGQAASKVYNQVKPMLALME